MKHHIAAAAAALVAGLMLVGPGTALAQNTAGSSQGTATAPPGASLGPSTFTNIPVTGQAGNKALKATFTVDRFVTRNDATYALGTLKGTVGRTHFSRKDVLMPVSVQKSSAKTAQLGAVCQLVNLVLGPLHLNVLGLHVDTKRIVVNITAVPGAGQLLGNLLCAVANLLNGTGVGGAAAPALTPAQLTGLLNTLLGLGNTPGLTSLLP